MHHGTVLRDANKKPVPQKQSRDALYTSLFSSLYATWDWRIRHESGSMHVKHFNRQTVNVHFPSRKIVERLIEMGKKLHFA